MSWVLLGAALLFTLLSALVSAAESAVFAVGPSRLRTLREEGFRGADTLQRVRDEGSSVRASAFFLNTALNAAAVGAVSSEAALRNGVIGVAVAVPLSVLGVLLFAELVPRRVAVGQSIRLALLLAAHLERAHRFVHPVLAPLSGVNGFFQRRGGEDAETPDEREVREMTDLGQEEGVVGQEERDLVERVFRLDELTAWDIMTPRVDMFAWKASLTLGEIVSQFHTVPYSRVPVYGDSIDDITGVLHVREAYEAFISGRSGLQLSELAREPFFLPGSLPLPRLLKDFQTRRIHLGIVGDEFGGTDGLVTLEDVLEELVGEIEDETDIAEEPLVKVSRNEAIAHGTVELREVNQTFNLSLPYLDYRSLNGFILEEAGRVPAKGDVVSFPGLDIEILEASDTQVLKARLSKTHSKTSTGG